MNFSELRRLYILILIIVVLIMGLLVAFFIGKKQDKAFKNEDALYGAMVQHIEEKKFEDALILAEGIKEQQKKSEILNYATALIYGNTGDFDQAARNMQRALDLNPHKVEDSIFMLQFAEMLLFAERNEDAAVVLEKCATLPIPESYPQYMERIEQLQGQLNG
ncbi:hypothetical protein H9649_08380 [Sporosarcina sp. Sa2YVA2]|uniref:Tetratricopeptide repeat protein n=1 Tax=Sporosarcina quadrami TaxID=2762234 RepID=A0ABR8U978_9BACL|nr:hypothetical protein [Sporosarcina quadrami]MBD7984593.1 hypothetical protein [Sporosarcina quadrami]